MNTTTTTKPHALVHLSIGELILEAAEGFRRAGTARSLADDVTQAAPAESEASRHAYYAVTDARDCFEQARNLAAHIDLAIQHGTKSVDGLEQLRRAEGVRAELVEAGKRCSRQVRHVRGLL